MSSQTAVSQPLSESPLAPRLSQEELANTLSHGLGLLLALSSIPLLANDIDTMRHPMRLAGALVFIGTMVLMFLVSTLYHALPAGPAKTRLRRMDHAVIFVFIAGSYTPFALGQVQRGEGWLMFAAVWAIALGGVALKLCDRLRHPTFSTALYLAFGWMVVVVARPMLESLPPEGLKLLVAGGLAYTLGSLFFLLDRRLRYSHFIWHLFVITGSSCHFMAVQHAVS